MSDFRNIVTKGGAVDWMTDRDVLAKVARAFGVDRIPFDPAASVDPANHFAEESWTLGGGRDALLEEWPLLATFLNPPFGASYVRGAECLSVEQHKAAVEEGRDLTGFRKQTILDFAVKFCAAMARPGAQGIWLSKASTETKAIQRVLREATVVHFPNERLNYLDAATGKKVKGVSFPSFLAYFGTHSERFRAAFAAGVSLVPLQAARSGSSVSLDFATTAWPGNLGQMVALQ